LTLVGVALVLTALDVLAVLEALTLETLALVLATLEVLALEPSAWFGWKPFGA